MNILPMRNRANTQGLMDLINILPNDITMAEIGCYMGESTRMFLESNKIKHLYAIDIWDDNLGIYKDILPNHDFKIVEKKFDENTKNYDVTKLKMTSEEALPFLPELDVIYIDANHSYEYVKKDIEISLKKLKRNGIICGHDYNSETEGVIQAVNEYFEKPDIVFSDSSWLTFIKR